jgi:outer membrane lipoprotein-sorting protein
MTERRESMKNARTVAVFILVSAGVAGALWGQAGAPPGAEELIRRADAIMYPDAKAVVSFHSRDAKGRIEDYGAVYYAKDRNQKIIVRMTAPASEVGNDLLMIEQNVWAYDRRANRVMKVASNQAFGGTGFSYGDVVRLNFSDNYAPILKKETLEAYVLELTAKDRGAPYYRIELEVDRKGGWPLKGVCYARNGRIVKEIRYSGVRDLGTGMKPAVLTVTSALDPGETNEMTLLSEKAMELPDRVFNKRNLETRMEEGG